MFKFEPGNYIKTTSFADHELFWAIGCFMNSGAEVFDTHIDDFHDGLALALGGDKIFLGMTPGRELKWSYDSDAFGKKRELIDNPFYVEPIVVGSEHVTMFDVMGAVI